MKTNSFSSVQANPTTSFDLRRLSKSKEDVDLCSNTLRAYHKAGLPFYKMGKVTFYSLSELERFIRSKAA